MAFGKKAKTPRNQSKEAVRPLRSALDWIQPVVVTCRRRRPLGVVGGLGFWSLSSGCLSIILSGCLALAGVVCVVVRM